MSLGDLVILPTSQKHLDKPRRSSLLLPGRTPVQYVTMLNSTGLAASQGTACNQDTGETGVRSRCPRDYVFVSRKNALQYNGDCVVWRLRRQEHTHLLWSVTGPHRCVRDTSRSGHCRRRVRTGVTAHTRVAPCAAVRGSNAPSPVIFNLTHLLAQKLLTKILWHTKKKFYFASLTQNTHNFDSFTPYGYCCVGCCHFFI